MKREALTSKILVLGVDGMDPRLAKHCMDKGLMPNLKTLVEKGSAKEDLSLLGAMPTITPPMWTTLATGAYPMTHGITCFWNQHPEKLDTLKYALDSRECKAEQLWNVFAEAGKKTLVWHWPGSSWPPTSNSELLHVVDGTQPACVNWGVAIIDWEKMLVAKPEFEKNLYKPKANNDTGAGCILTDVNAADEMSTGMVDNLDNDIKESKNIMFSHEDGDMAIDRVPFDIINTPLKDADGWSFELPEGAKEFTVITSTGLIRRPALLLKNDSGEYATIVLYKNKKVQEPLITLTKDDGLVMVYDEIMLEDGTKSMGNRMVRIMDLEPDGSYLRLWMSCALDVNNDLLWHPKSLYKEIAENIGVVPPGSMASGRYIEQIDKLIMPCWDNYCDWQAKALNYLIDEEKYDVVFSHIHNVDAMGHMFWHFAKSHKDLPTDEAAYKERLERVYVQTDNYLGEFLHYLDEGWTILVVSDHGLTCSTEEHVPLIGDPFGVNAIMMKELGYTVLQQDEDGNDLREIDWSKTKAVAARGNHIYINLKGRDAHGIVDPEDKYELEKEIISALYNYRLDGKRVINIALRNKDAALLGMSGDECGDIIYWLEEGHNRVHGDSLSTTQGYNDTSVSPIFVAAGQGVKAGFVPELTLRQIDFAPTLAVLGGVRMPRQCEGAPMYSLLTEEF